jgi:hypothetical protein
VTVRQLERWRASGAIPGSLRRSHGRGRGRTSSQAEEDIDYIVEFASRSRRRREWFRVVIWIFMDGLHVPDQCIRAAYDHLHSLWSLAFDQLSMIGDHVAQAEWLAASQLQHPNSHPLKIAIRRAHRSLEASGHFQRVDDREVPTLHSFEFQNLYNVSFSALTGQVNPGTETELLEVTRLNPALHLSDRTLDLDPEKEDDFAARLESLQATKIHDAMATAPIWALQMGVNAMRNPEIYGDVGERIVGLPTLKQLVYPIAYLLAARDQCMDESDKTELTWEQFHELIFGE